MSLKQRCFSSLGMSGIGENPAVESHFKYFRLNSFLIAGEPKPVGGVCVGGCIWRLVLGSSY